MKKTLSFILAALLLVAAMTAVLPLSVFAADPALQKTALELYVGETDRIEVQNADAAITWTSADSRIVSVAADGTLTAKAVGQTTVTAKTGGKTLTCTVYVVEKEYDFNDNICISVFWPPSPGYVNDEQYKLMADAGITLVMGSGNGCTTYDTQRKMADLCYKYGMKLVVDDGGFGTALLGKTEEKIQAHAEKWRNYPAVNGYYLKDEPPDALAYVDAYAALKKMDPNAFMHLNFTAGNAQVEDWLKTCEATGYHLDYVMYDMYPYPLDAGSMRRDVFLACQRDFHNVALKYGVKTGQYIQAVCQEVMFRDPTADEVRYQVYMALAYGFKQLSYFTWFTPVNQPEPFRNGIVSADGVPNERYDEIAALNHEVLAIGPILSRSEAIDIYLNGQTWGQPAIPADFAVQPLDQVNYTVTRFVHKETGRSYLMFVNNDFSKEQTFSVKLEGIAGLWEISKTDGSQSPVTLKDGELTLTLAAGDGVLFAMPEDYVAEDKGDNTPVRDTAPGTNLALTSDVFAYTDINGNGTIQSVLRDGKKGVNAGSWAADGRNQLPTLMVDLKEPLAINRVDVYPAGNLEEYGENMMAEYTVQVSDDGKSWTDVATGKYAVGDGEAATIRFDTVTTRYLRVNTLKRLGRITEFSEIEVYRDDGTMPDAPNKWDMLLAVKEPASYIEGMNLLMGKPVYYSSALIRNGEWMPNYINDSNPYTGCCTQIGVNHHEKSTEYFMIDMGDVFLIDRVEMTPRGTYPLDFEIQLSDDGKEWRTFCARSGEAPNEDSSATVYEGDNGPVSGRFLRIYATKLRAGLPQDGYHMQLGECKAFGIPVCDRTALTEALALYESEGCDTSAAVYTTAKSYLEMEYLTQTQADALTKALLAIAAPPPPETEPETEPVSDSADVTESESETVSETDPPAESDPDETAAEPEKKGCESVLAASAWVAVMLAVPAVALLRKRENE